MGIKANSNAWPAVGTEQRTTYGGVSGNATRPIGLRAVSSISRTLPGYPIMATGGIDSADAALQYLFAGASVLQICSSVQNQDFTVVQDYITGLKCYLYLQSRADLADWDGQSPPTKVPAVYQNKHLPKFGPYQQERNKIRKETALKADLLTPPPAPKEPVQKPVPAVKDLIGMSVSRIGNYNSLNNKEQVRINTHIFTLRC